MNISINNEIILEPEFFVFKNDGRFTVISTLVKDNLVSIEIFGCNISPKKLNYLTKFEADGRSDFNWGMLFTWKKYGNIIQKIKARRHLAKGV
jgi:hypothetical protein